MLLLTQNAYWSAANSLEEAAYVAAILNTTIVLDRVKDLQPVGQRDPRHFDNLVWTLPIPEFDAAEALHVDLAAAALHAAEVAARVELPDARAFHRQATIDPAGAGRRRRGGNDRAPRRRAASSLTPAFWGYAIQRSARYLPVHFRAQSGRSFSRSD